jgi:hypothetical protein
LNIEIPTKNLKKLLTGINVTNETACLAFDGLYVNLVVSLLRFLSNFVNSG